MHLKKTEDIWMSNTSAKNLKNSLGTGDLFPPGISKEDFACLRDAFGSFRVGRKGKEDHDTQHFFFSYFKKVSNLEGGRKKPLIRQRQTQRRAPRRAQQDA